MNVWLNIYCGSEIAETVTSDFRRKSRGGTHLVFKDIFDENVLHAIGCIQRGVIKSFNFNLDIEDREVEELFSSRKKNFVLGVSDVVEIVAVEESEIVLSRRPEGEIVLINGDYAFVSSAKKCLEDALDLKFEPIRVKNYNIDLWRCNLRHHAGNILTQESFAPDFYEPENSIRSGIFISNYMLTDCLLRFDLGPKGYLQEPLILLEADVCKRLYRKSKSVGVSPVFLLDSDIGKRVSDIRKMILGESCCRSVLSS